MAPQTLKQYELQETIKTGFGCICVFVIFGGPCLGCLYSEMKRTFDDYILPFLGWSFLIFSVVFVSSIIWKGFRGGPIVLDEAAPMTKEKKEEEVSKTISAAWNIGNIIKDLFS